MTQVNKEKIKTGVWGAVGGAVIAIIIGFAWGGWVVGGTAQTMAEAAVIDRLSPICVEQFNQDPQRDEKLKGLKAADSWNRDEYVIKQGWATMPGEKAPDRRVADRCSELIMKNSQ
jgi:hypothetical protein